MVEKRRRWIFFLIIMIVMAILMIKLVRRESDARVEKKIKLEDILEIEKR